MMNTQNNTALKNIITLPMQVIGSMFEKQGHEIRIVGGAVRDALMGVEPKDIDFATTATPDEMIEICKLYGFRYIETGLQHGTITILHADDQYEVTTLRADVATNGRHAEVKFINDWEEDARRRDFTINAMSVDLHGNLHDYFDGERHLKTGVLKFVGDAASRIQEDYLRILRYFRFAKRLGLKVSDDYSLENTVLMHQNLSIIKNNAHGLKQISGERIWMEMEKILGGDNVSTNEVLHMMYIAEVFGHITPSEQFFPYPEGGSYTLTDPIAVLAYGTRHYYDDEVVELINRWKFSKHDRDHLMFLWKNRYIQVDYRLMAVDHSLEVALEVALMQERQDIYENLKDWEVPVFPVSGKDLLALGFAPGPRIGSMLHHMKIHWSAGGFKATKEELLCLKEQN